MFGSCFRQTFKYRPNGLFILVEQNAENIGVRSSILHVSCQFSGTRTKFDLVV